MSDIPFLPRKAVRDAFNLAGVLLLYLALGVMIGGAILIPILLALEGSWWMFGFYVTTVGLGLFWEYGKER